VPMVALSGPLARPPCPVPAFRWLGIDEDKRPVRRPTGGRVSSFLGDGSGPMVL